MSAKKALVFLGEGFEELEAVAAIDLLRRAGVSCFVASCEAERWVKGRNGMRLEADGLLGDVEADALFDCVVVPGGPGVARLKEDERVLSLIRRHHAAGKIVAAICAAPLVLNAAGVLGARYTGHFSIAEQLPALIDDQRVVVDGSIITSRGAGTAVHFGLALVRMLVSEEAATEVAASIHHV